jgi:pimeloyl-ACP methyl ester carboxylesterase
MTRAWLCVLVLAVPTAALAQAPKPLPPAEAKAAFLKLLDRPKVPLDPRPGPGKTTDQFALETLTIASEKKADGSIERVPLLVVKGASFPGPAPAVIVLHGTGGSKENLLDLLEEFARQGLVAVGVDARYHGERTGGRNAVLAYNEAITRAWRTPAGRKHEHPMYYDTCWDLWRVIDYLQTRDDVVKDRIGMLGISMGGIQTWLAASVDDRVKVAAPLLAVQSFRWSFENGKWHGRQNTVRRAHEAAAKDLGLEPTDPKVCRAFWDRLLPGIDGDFDCPNLLPLFAGRALFAANGEIDGHCPLPGVEIAFRSADEAFTRAGGREKLDLRVAKGVAHELTPPHRAAAVEFCVKWLK